MVKKLTGGKTDCEIYGAELIEKEAVITGEDNGLIQILAGGEKYEVIYLLVCTGSDTVIPPIKGFVGNRLLDFQRGFGNGCIT